MPSYHSMDVKDVFKGLKSSKEGLSDKEAKKRIDEYGLNAIKDEKKISAIEIFINQFKSFLVILLLLAAGISLVLSFQPGFEDHLVDVILILIIVLANAVFGFVQDFKAEKSISELKKMSSLNSKVIRDGKIIEVSSEKLVPGDLVLLEQGSIVPADARIIESSDLKVNESMLTGESQPVSKNSEIVAEKTLMHSQKDMLFMDTIISRGKVKAIIINTGMKTEVGKIAKSISEAEDKITPFENEIDVLGKKIAFAVLAAIIIIFITQFFFNQDVSLLTLIMVAISLAVAAVPEGLPAVVTLSLAIGTQKMLKKNALVRKLSVVESLGSVNVICSDKTGTLTRDEMNVSRILFDGKVFDLKMLKNARETDPILTAGLVSNDCMYSERDGKKILLGDATEQALVNVAESHGFSMDGKKKELALVKEIPFDAETRRMTTMHKNGGRLIIYSKGAFEEIIKRCSHYQENGKTLKLTDDKAEEFHKIHNSFSSDSLRVLGFAFKEISDEKEFSEDGLVFMGLQGMMDMPRENVLQALEDCRNAGIRIVMITGDNRLTASAIGKQLGFQGEAVEGVVIKEMSDSELKKAVLKTEIFARVLPEQKTRILKAFQEQGFVVGMTGDGINDAPALKNSDVGVAMGIKGTDVTKQASDMILLDDNFITIRNAIAEGRNIFKNIQKFVNYLLSANMAEVLVVFLTSIFGLGLALTAVQILWMNLLTDGLPALALAFDPKPKNIMKERSHTKKQGIIDRRMTFSIIYTGVALSLVIIGIFITSLSEGLVKAQTMAFTSLVFFELIRIHFVRSAYGVKVFSNKWLYGAIALTILMQLAILFIPFLTEIFKLAVLSWNDFVVIFIGAVVFAVLMFIGNKLESIFVRKNEMTDVHAF